MEIDYPENECIETDVMKDECSDNGTVINDSVKNNIVEDNVRNNVTKNDIIKKDDLKNDSAKNIVVGSDQIVDIFSKMVIAEALPQIQENKSLPIRSVTDNLHKIQSIPLKKSVHNTKLTHIGLLVESINAIENKKDMTVDDLNTLACLRRQLCYFMSKKNKHSVKDNIHNSVGGINLKRVFSRIKMHMNRD